jgi:hypothetical protein
MSLSETQIIKQLTPSRFRIIADYPNADGRVGDIIHCSSIPEHDHTAFYSKFPHLFQKLNWWEERSKDIMPKYVRDTQTNEVYELLTLIPPYVIGQVSDCRARIHLNQLEPATEQQYRDQYKPTIEQLLQPRYKVIADYPGNVQPIGHIHSCIGDEQSIRYWAEQKEKYPQVFKRLEWWEHRTDSELPRYMKYADNPEVVFMFLATKKSNPEKAYLIDGENHESCELLRNLFPATEQEYTSQPKYRG